MARGDSKKTGKLFERKMPSPGRGDKNGTYSLKNNRGKKSVECEKTRKRIKKKRGPMKNRGGKKPGQQSPSKRTIDIADENSGKKN